MSLCLLLGGARSGKSSLAVHLARRAGTRVTVVATAEARDDEMAARIDQHQAERPEEWATIEEPLALATAIESVEADAALIVDCLSLWVANALEHGLDVERDAAAAATIAAARTGATIAVSNEVGLGVVPATPLGRRYRDVLGRVNAIWADAAADVFFVAAGRMLRLSRPEESLP
jgi:adenosyl cobinamide kinase/adenosyl cobinamide phosphate guanylyltransferase